MFVKINFFFVEVLDELFSLLNRQVKSINIYGCYTVTDVMNLSVRWLYVRQSGCLYDPSTNDFSQFVSSIHLLGFFYCIVFSILLFVHWFFNPYDQKDKAAYLYISTEM